MTPRSSSPVGAAAAERAPWVGAGLVFGGFLAVYVATRQYNLSTYHDAVMHVRTVLAPIGPHPHHLLFRWMERGWLRAMGTLDASPHVAAASAAVLSALAAATVVTLVFLLLQRRFGLPSGSAVLGAALVGCSYGTWLHATVINVYMVPLALLLACLYLLTSAAPRGGTYVAVALLHALAVLVHQAYVLFAVVVALAAWTDRRALGVRVRGFLTYAGLAGTLTVAAYVLVGVFAQGTRSVGDFAYWITTYAHEGYAKVPGVVGLVKAAIGFVRACFGAPWIFALPGTHDLIARIFSHGLSDEDFLVRSISGAAAVGLLAVTLLGGALILALPIASRRAWRDVVTGHRRPVLLAAATLGVFTAFFVFWKPELLEFWMPQLTMFWLLWAALVLRPGGRVGVRAAATVLLIATLVVSSFLGGIRLLASPQNDYYYACTDAAAPVLAPAAPVLVGSEYLGDYLKLFRGLAPQRMALPDGDPTDEGALDPALIADQLAADPSRRGVPVVVYVVGTPVPPPLLSRAAAPPQALLDRPCEVWRVTLGSPPAP